MTCFDLVDAVVERLTREGELVHNLSLRNLCDLSNVICFHRDTPAARNVLLKGLDCILAEEPELLQTKEAVTFLLALAHLGLYNRSACELLFTSPVLTQHSHKAGGRIMNKLVRYDNIIGTFTFSPRPPSFLGGGGVKLPSTTRVFSGQIEG